MSLIYNGTTITALNYNGTSIQSATYNGTTVFASEPSSDSVSITMKYNWYRLQYGSEYTNFYWYLGASTSIPNIKIISINPSQLKVKSQDGTYICYVNLSCTFSYNESEKISTITIDSGGESVAKSGPYSGTNSYAFTYEYYPV